MENALKSLQETVGTRMDGLETRMDRIETKIDRIDTKMDRIETKIDGLETKMETKFDGLYANNCIIIAQLADITKALTWVKASLFAHSTECSIENASLSFEAIRTNKSWRTRKIKIDDYIRFLEFGSSKMNPNLYSEFENIYLLSVFVK